MPKHSKRFLAAATQVDKNKVYSLVEAVEILKQTATAKFDESFEAHFRIGIDPKKGEQQIRSTVILPHGIGKKVRVAVFAAGDKAKEAKEAGADLVGEVDLIEEIKKSGKCDFDVAVATPDMMKPMAVIARILGPKGLMPSPKNETITTNVKKTVEELKKGKIAFKNDDTANVHQVIGKVSFDAAQIADNFRAFMEALEKAKPDTSKGVFIKSISLTTTMGPGLRIDLKNI
ncbi:TPA: 50S ribosomal protein L1 [Candidatus Falkowbacteria bacterium]|nr:50S ribosomal protein L1 [Candidatus Falkowbacteria bacterium]